MARRPYGTRRRRTRERNGGRSKRPSHFNGRLGGGARASESSFPTSTSMNRRPPLVSRQDIRVAVDNAVAGVTHNRFIYVIGGRSPSGASEQRASLRHQKNTWTAATPFPGTPVFGLAGGVADEEIVVVDGAKKGPEGGPRYVASEGCWLGKIDKKDPDKIEWSKLPPHPGMHVSPSPAGARTMITAFFFRRHGHSSRLQRRRLRWKAHGRIRLQL